MIKKRKKSSRLPAVMVAGVFLLTTLPFAVNAFQAPAKMTEDKTGYNFSNEEIGMSEKIKRLAGLDEAFMDKLKKEGFTETEITEAKLFSERILFQLNEIIYAVHTMHGKSEAEILSELSAMKNSGHEAVPNASGVVAQKDDDLYIELVNKFNIELAVTLMLKLKEDFGDIEKVMDEYLFSLQAGIKLEEYFTDKPAYLKKRDEKRMEIGLMNIVTIQKIEEKMLESIQNSIKANSASMDDFLPDKMPGNTDKNSNMPTDSIKIAIPSEIIPESGIKTVRPENPAEKILNEINGLSPVKN